MEEADLYGKLALELMDARSDQIRLGVDHQETRDLGGEVFVLDYLQRQARESRPCHPKDISLRMGVTSARVATILKGLERRGLLTRRIDRQDARQTVVELTEEGSAFILRHRRAVKERFARTLRALGHEDAAELVRIMKKLVRCLSSCESGNSNAPTFDQDALAVTRASETKRRSS